MLPRLANVLSKPQDQGSLYVVRCCARFLAGVVMDDDPNVKRPRSALREALDTMGVVRSGRPVADLVRMIAKLGSTMSETAALLDMDAERLISIVEGLDALSHQEADLAHAYLLGLWWWHSYRQKWAEARTLEAVEEAHRRLANVWDRLPRSMRIDWSAAHRSAREA